MTDQDEHVGRLAAANNELGFQLLSQLIEEEKGEGHNVFISSFSVALALAMTYNGAEGETRRAMARVLGLTDLSLEEVNETNAALMAMQEGLDAQVQLAIANSIWLRQGVEPAPDFIQRIRDYYAGEVASLDFGDPEAADVINAWVAGETNDKIKELVKPGDIKLAILILINAVYFKGIWATQFDEAKTEERDFALPDGSHQRHPMMSQSGEYRYYENERFQAVSLPYGEGRGSGWISMYLFLPKPTVPLDAFMSTLTLESWQQWMSSFYPMEGDIVLPRFKIEYGTDLISNLKKLGGEILAGTDFVGMGAGPLFISKVIHKTFVEVNEEGTEAAAATAVVMARGLSYRFSMVLDRPFFCAIRDNETGLLLFTGVVQDPTHIRD